MALSLLFKKKLNIGLLIILSQIYKKYFNILLYRLLFPIQIEETRSI